MNDPAYEMDDFRQDAQLAVLSGRLENNGIPAAIANAKRTRHRRMTCRQRHADSLRHHCKIRPGEQSPVEVVAVSEEAAMVIRRLIKDAPQELIIVLLQQTGWSREQIASAVGVSIGTISRARRRAKSICTEYLSP